MGKNVKKNFGRQNDTQTRQGYHENINKISKTSKIWTKSSKDLWRVCSDFWRQHFSCSWNFPHIWNMVHDWLEQVLTNKHHLWMKSPYSVVSKYSTEWHLTILRGYGSIEIWNWTSGRLPLSNSVLDLLTTDGADKNIMLKGICGNLWRFCEFIWCICEFFDVFNWINLYFWTNIYTNMILEECNKCD